MIIKAYSKQELAMLYFPEIDPEVARKHLVRWISRCKPLQDALKASHLSKSAKFYTPYQVGLILDKLGEPYNKS